MKVCVNADSFVLKNTISRRLCCLCFLTEHSALSCPTCFDKRLPVGRRSVATPAQWRGCLKRKSFVNSGRCFPSVESGERRAIGDITRPYPLQHIILVERDLGDVRHCNPPTNVNVDLQERTPAVFLTCDDANTVFRVSSEIHKEKVFVHTRFDHCFADF